jgi:hypothetical protein
MAVDTRIDAGTSCTDIHRSAYIICWQHLPPDRDLLYGASLRPPVCAGTLDHIQVVKPANIGRARTVCERKQAEYDFMAASRAVYIAV